MDRQALLSALLARVGETRAAIGAAWPYHADPETGIWETVEDGDWCGGHWVECLRIAGRLEGRPELIEEARDRTERLRPKLETDDQFRGHRFYYSAARLYAETGDPRLRTLALAAAYAVRSMAIPQNGAMPIGMQVQVKSTTLASRRIVAVDNVHPNLRLDYWAGPETGDPVFAEGAKRMLDLTIRDFVRADGSTVEFIEYHETEDRILRRFTLLGVDDDSCWSRGQAWAVSGFLRGWQEFGETRYRDAAARVWSYWQGHVGAGVPPWDFNDPDGDDAPRDSSAAAIVVEQLARMAVADGNSEARNFTRHLDPMLEALAEHVRPTGRLVDGCFNRPKRFADRSELIWGTAYLLMALCYLEEGEVPC
jgi:unsaturated chondroitin disaccharide hydrolase